MDRTWGLAGGSPTGCTQSPRERPQLRPQGGAMELAGPWMLSTAPAQTSRGTGLRLVLGLLGGRCQAFEAVSSNRSGRLEITAVLVLLRRSDCDWKQEASPFSLLLPSYLCLSLTKPKRNSLAGEQTVLFVEKLVHMLFCLCGGNSSG